MNKKIIKAGTPVSVELVQSKSQHNGILLNDFLIFEQVGDDEPKPLQAFLEDDDFMMSLAENMPLIQLDNGQVVEGIDCFWTPKKESKQ